MKLSFKTFLSLLFISLSISVVAQKKTTKQGESSGNSKEGARKEITQANDSIVIAVGKLEDVKIYKFSSKYIGFKDLSTIDTILHTVELYSPAKQTQTFSQDLGIIGSANTPLILIFDPQTTFDLGIHSYDLFIRDISELEIFKTPTPITQLSYTMGSKKENNLRVQHAQSLMDEQLKFGIDFQLRNTIGYYARQLSDVKNFHGNLSYRTKDNRYAIEGVYFHNKLVLQENGGIIVDSLFEKNYEDNRQIIGVNLDDAENVIRHSGVGIKQTFFLAKAEPDYSAIPDTNLLSLAGYSVQHYMKPYFDPITPLGRLTHTFIYSNESYVYNDTDGTSDFYKDIVGFPEDLTETFDSISHRKIENTISYSNADYKDNIDDPRFLTYSFGIGLNSHRYNQYNKKYSVNLTLSEIIPQGRIQLFLTNRLSLLASGLYSYRSDNTSAYKIDGDLNLQIGKNDIHIGVLSSTSQPKFIYEHYYSDYFQWEHSFLNQKYQELTFQFNRKLTQLKAKTGLTHGYLYIDETITPQQTNEALSFFNVSLYQAVRLGNFGLDLNFIYQKVSDATILRAPEIYTNTQLFYANTIFKGALDLELGFNIRYFSKYYANTYMPALRSFYIQNEKEYGNYPYVDVYLNIQIKRARLFIKYEQLNASLMPLNYFIGPHYPNPDASIKFGVIWQMFY